MGILLAVVRDFRAMFREARANWANEADRLDAWAAEQDLQMGQETTASTAARFRAVVLRFGAVVLGEKV